MKINPTQITYTPHVRNRDVSEQNQPPRSRGVEKQQPAAGASAGVGDEKQAVDLTAPLSTHLSSEEQSMIHELFPASGSGFGVNAYRSRAASGATAAVRGRNLDITT